MRLPSAGLLLLVALGPTCASASAAPSTAEARLLALANDARAAEGHAPLLWDDELAVVARAHAADMRLRGEIGHVSSDGSRLEDRVARADVRVERVAENVARAGSVESAHEALMASRHHRENLLDEGLLTAGFGVVEAEDGAWVVQDFATPAKPWTEPAATEAILAELRRRGWASRLDPAMSRALRPVADHMAAADSASVRNEPNPGCWILGMSGPDPSALPEGRHPSCRGARAGVAAVWARTPTRPLGAWFVAVAVAP